MLTRGFTLQNTTSHNVYRVIPHSFPTLFPLTSGDCPKKATDNCRQAARPSGQSDRSNASQSKTCAGSTFNSAASVSPWLSLAMLWPFFHCWAVAGLTPQRRASARKLQLLRCKIADTMSAVVRLLDRIMATPVALITASQSLYSPILSVCRIANFVFFAANGSCLQTVYNYFTVLGVRRLFSSSPVAGVRPPFFSNQYGS